MARIVLYTDEPILAAGLTSILAGAGGLELAACCSSFAAVHEELSASHAEIVLLDLTPDVTFTALTDLKKAFPYSNILLWVNTISTELAFQAMGLGIRGILRKTLPADLQIKCLQKVLGGELWFEKALTDSFLSARRVALTHREGQLVSLLSQGLKNKEIATCLSISEGTVKVYMSRLFQKLGVKDRLELALFGLKNMNVAQNTAAEKPARPQDIRGLRSLVMENASGKPTLPVSSESYRRLALRM